MAGRRRKARTHEKLQHVRTPASFHKTIHPYAAYIIRKLAQNSLY